ncbi:MAG: MmcQ/YjbR family DNA-binding protein [Candidatus Kapabacteria bacterium]|nr:MmcQ/YjbR family DNA-binding protein [Ignavibacteriota bacterium]MCW5884689.1 MmcQ/YjbR family DNA-binding protein [Candidatus Kapabacteria bacterium]
MTLEEISRYCLSLPLVTEDVKWDNVLCYSVAGKLFFVVSLDEVPCGASFKVPDDVFEELSENPNFIQAPYFAKNKWIKILDIGNLKISDKEEFILQAYNLIKQKLTKKLQKDIDDLFTTMV